MRTLLVAAPLAVALSACMVHKIPGTDIDDNDDTRAILGVVGAYQKAVERKDVPALVALADKSFRDDGGSPDPDDDLDYQTLSTALPARFARLQDVRLDVAVRRIELDPSGTNARVTYTYTLTFRMPQLASRTQSETDIKQMLLKRDGPHDWKIVSGI